MFRLERSEIEHFYKGIKRYIRKTPIERSEYYSRLIGAEVFLKLENQQITGSFKIRGALRKVFSLREDDFAKGVYAVSAGNHALGVAYALSKRGKKGTIILPENASQAKIDVLKLYDSINLEFRGKDYGQAEDYTVDYVRAHDKAFVSPYNDAEILAGQSTLAFETFTEVRDSDILLVPLGGGGLLAGSLLFKQAFELDFKVYGVQSEASPAFKKAIEAGKIIDIPLEDSIADGLHGLIQNETMTFPIVEKYVEDVLLVSEQEIADEYRNYTQYHHNMVEASAMVNAAALKRYASLFKGKKVMCLMTGANIDTDLFASLIKS